MGNFCNYYFYKHVNNKQWDISQESIAGAARCLSRRGQRNNRTDQGVSQTDVPLESISHVEMTLRVGRCWSKCTVSCFGRLILTRVWLRNVVIANESNDSVPIRRNTDPVPRSALKGHRLRQAVCYLFKNPKLFSHFSLFVWPWNENSRTK